MSKSIDKIIEEWEKSELAKRVEASEMFAINHGFDQWAGQTIPDFLRHALTTVVKEREAELVREIEVKKKDIESRRIHLKQLGISKSNRIHRRKETEHFNLGLSTAIEIITNPKDNEKEN